jgi:hypothetical protein
VGVQELAGCGSRWRVFFGVHRWFDEHQNMDTELLCELISVNVKKAGAPFSAPA